MVAKTPKPRSTNRGQFPAGESTPEVAEKWAEAVRLRTQGRTFAEIAAAIGYSHASVARRAVMAALKDSIREAGLEELRALEAERLDRLQKSRWEMAEAGDDDALDRVLKIMKRRAELLGLDAPVKHQVEMAVAKEYDVTNSPEAL